MAEQPKPTLEPSPPAAASPHLPPSVSTVTVKILPFCPANPEVWFAQVEAQFTIHCITNQRATFDHVVTALAPEVTTKIRDLLNQPPAEAPYDNLRAQ